MKQTTKLKQLLSNKKTIIAPGIFDGLSARLAEQAGFSVLYASGGAIARSCGYPDLGLLSFNEVCERLQQIIDVVKSPIIADADTGFGNEMNVRRTVRQFERLGIAALHLEDQTFPKRCGHLNDKSLIPIEEMCLKIKVAKDSLSDPDFTLIARTDAVAVEGIEAALRRAEAYYQAGAGMLFIEAPESLEQVELIAKRIPYPKLINMFQGGKTPLVAIEKLQVLGYQLVIIPSDLQRAAMAAMQKTLAAILTEGDSHSLANQLTSFKERETIVGTEDYLNLGK
ncbi:MAG: isocitrate lyase [Gammaproteobacteria bacterium RIFCSPHIGHO2_12_FULL_35_23]|nr:MAG: isocitrate lyase [Gammaproteobacteria bacterium RIFCSPHIGHO2_12_FULL_35_23]